MDQLTIPYHVDDPASSREAAAKVRPKVGGQLLLVLQAVSIAGELSNREIQIRVCGENNPGHPAWNKIPTRCRTLQRKGLLELVTDDDGDPVLKEHPSGGRFMVWRAV